MNHLSSMTIILATYKSLTTGKSTYSKIRSFCYYRSIHPDWWVPKEGWTWKTWNNKNVFIL